MSGELSSATSDIIESLRRRAAQRPPQPPPVIHRILPADLDRDIPPEYHGAILEPRLAEALRGRPVSILLHGPTGVGKTRQAWAMLRASRRSRLRDLIEHGEAVSQVWNGQVWRPERDRGEWLSRAFGSDRVWIFNEVGDLRRHGYDHAWLDRLVSFPGFLVMDDVARLDGTPWVQEALYRLSNDRRAWSRPTVWTTNADGNLLTERLGDAITSRITGGLVITLTGRDRRMDGA